MAQHYPIFKELPLAQIEIDPEHPRKDLGPEADMNRLFKSIQNFGLHLPIVVMRIAESRYIIIDGQRRVACAQQAGWNAIPCLVHGKMSAGDFHTLRFDIQNNYKRWTVLERAEVLYQIKSHLSATAG